MLHPIHIEATTIPDAWFQALYATVEHGRPFKIDKGSYAGQQRMELDWITIHITRPWERCVEGLPLIPEMPEGGNLPPPVTKEYVRQYAQYIMTADKKPGEQYTYGERLVEADFFKFAFGLLSSHKKGNQIERVIETYKTYGHRNNQMVLQIAQPSDLLLDDPPCLRHIDTRIQDGKLHFFPYFRSWDLYGGLPANLAGVSMLQEYMAGAIGVEQGEMIATSKGLHLYDYAWEIARARAGR